MCFEHLAAKCTMAFLEHIAARAHAIISYNNNYNNNNNNKAGNV